MTRLATCATLVPERALEIAQDSSRPDAQRSYAAVVAAVGFRRASNRAKSRAAIDVLTNVPAPWGVAEKQAEALRLHLLSLTYLDGSPDDLREGIGYSRRANELSPNSPGLQHALAEFLLESAIWVAKSEAEQRKLLVEAQELVERALVGQRWPKFVFTQARIELRLAESPEEYRRALADLSKASDEEARATVDSASRRSRYQYERLIAEMRMELAAEADAAEERVERMLAEQSRKAEELIAEQARRTQIQAVAAVGFITALLGLLQFAPAIFITAKEAAGDSARDAFGYLVVAVAVMAVVLMGCVAFGVFIVGRAGRKRDSASANEATTTTKSASA